MNKKKIIEVRKRAFSGGSRIGFALRCFIFRRSYFGFVIRCLSRRYIRFVFRGSIVALCFYSIAAQSLV